MYKNTEKYPTKCRQMHRDVTNNAFAYDKRLKKSMNKELPVVKQQNTRHTFYRLKQITISNIRLVPSIAMEDKPSKNNRIYQTQQDLLKSKKASF